MSLPQRARILSAKQSGPPSEGALRFAHPANYLPLLRYAFRAVSWGAANDGLEFVNIWSGKCEELRPLARWKNRGRPPTSSDPVISDGAAGVPEEVMGAAELIPFERRAAVFTRRIPTFRFQRCFWDLRLKLRCQSASTLSDKE